MTSAIGIIGGSGQGWEVERGHRQGTVEFRRDAVRGGRAEWKADPRRRHGKAQIRQYATWEARYSDVNRVREQRRQIDLGGTGVAALGPRLRREGS